MSNDTIKKILNTYGMVFILIALFLALSFSIDGFFSTRTIWSIIEQVSMFGIIAIGVTFAIITTGIDLSSGSIVALTSVVAASVVTGGDTVSAAILAFSLSLLLGALLGAINGGLTAIGSIPPFIATLGMMIIARGAAQLYSDGRPIDASSEAFTWISDVSFLGLPGLVILYIIIVIASHILLSRSTFGRHVYAVGGNLNAAKICGINTTKTLIWVYVLAGALSGLAGALLAARTYAGNPSYGLAWELDAIAAAVIGGVSLSGGIGTIPMCVIGALIIGTTNKGLNMMGVDPYWQQIVKGLIIVIAVLIDTLKRRKKA
ncbi:ABC transporter permease [Gallibacterium anatis]|jgi:inositol transport system permease protein|uniref:Ribose ABC transporter permease n=3 Tax=Gallibacterium anatis TaxID=750 RepID=U1GP19_9PAST|nr:ABC transporter permease [Gallibacterium anatis]ERF79377.1 ribose ABC transporter permease [Gallibacterium anatis 12656/12]KGQ26435.1 sugar ABC transporter permease [Gallibacterium anatis]KGQ35749.1 sugar ABC transporter permease [Gallibacterium anatis]KGQ41554.1 sugar ABC transporter permease [Gallibacterium anatis]KGQ46514.1 sugar ABC transporter permease [Gallibacterium anatis]